MAMEESNKERALEAVKRAEAALPPEEMAAAFVTTGWPVVVRHLFEAVRLLADDKPLIVLSVDPARFPPEATLDEYGPGQREELEHLAARIEEASSNDKTFTVSFPPVELKASEVWHEEHGEPIPDDVTAEDVVEVMRTYGKYPSPISVAAEWLLIEEITVTGPDGDEATYDG